MLGYAFTFLQLFTFTLLSPIQSFNNLALPISGFFIVIKGMSRFDILTNVLHKSENLYHYKLDLHQADDAFDQLKQSKKTIIIYNHIGWNDFLVSMQMLSKVERLNDLRWIAWKGLENKLSKPVLSRLETLLLSQKPEEDKEAIRAYVDKYQDKDASFALTIFPEGGLLGKENYLRCKNVMETKIGHIFSNMCTPYSGAVSQLLNAFPDADLFDVTIKYFDDAGSGDAINGDYIGDWYSVKNVALYGYAPDVVSASIRRLERPEEDTDIRKWLNDVWVEKEEILESMLDPRKKEQKTSKL